MPVFSISGQTGRSVLPNVEELSEEDYGKIGVFSDGLLSGIPRYLDSRWNEVKGMFDRGYRDPRNVPDVPRAQGGTGHMSASDLDFVERVYRSTVSELRNVHGLNVVELPKKELWRRYGFHPDRNDEYVGYQDRKGNLYIAKELTPYQKLDVLCHEEAGYVSGLKHEKGTPEEDFIIKMGRKKLRERLSSYERLELAA